MVEIKNEEKKVMIKMIDDWKYEIGPGSAKEYKKDVKKGVLSDFAVLDLADGCDEDPIYTPEEKAIIKRVRDRI